MKVLITGGSTMTMIDRVRGLTNVFKGNTGHQIAEFFADTEEVTILSSNKKKMEVYSPYNISQYHFKTYDELYNKMKALVTTNDYDVIIHSAAVSDYKVEGAYTYNDNNRIANELIPIDTSKKISSKCDEMYLKLIPTRKIVDDLRTLWGFKGILVKFKLQVGIDDNELIRIASESRIHSNAEIIVANCLEWCSKYAYIINESDVQRVDRWNLPNTLFGVVRKLLK